MPVHTHLYMGQLILFEARDLYHRPLDSGALQCKSRESQETSWCSSEGGGGRYTRTGNYRKVENTSKEGSCPRTRPLRMLF